MYLKKIILSLVITMFFAGVIIPVNAQFIPPAPPNTYSITGLTTKNTFLSSDLPFTDSEVKFTCNKPATITLRLMDTDFNPVALIGNPSPPNPINGIPCDDTESSYLFEGLGQTGAYIVIANIEVPTSQCVRCVVRDNFAVVKIVDRKIPDNNPILLLTLFVIIAIVLNKKN